MDPREKFKKNKVVFLRPLKIHGEPQVIRKSMWAYLPKFSTKLLPLITAPVIVVVFSFFAFRDGNKENAGGQVLGVVIPGGQPPNTPAQNSNENYFIKTAQAASLQDEEKKENKPFEYDVEGGDTLSGIAEKYNLKLDTVLWANNLTERTIIRPGQSIILLPVDGVLHEVEPGDTISKIALEHKADIQATMEYNEISDATKIHAGDKIIVPGGVPLPPKPQVVPKNGKSIQAPGSSIASSVAKLVWPTTHRNISQGYSASHRGLDIANGGKPAIVAAHSGKIEFSGIDGDWGSTILIRGDDGLVTRYSHNSENLVREGERVEAGATIGTVGNSGNVKGKTGLHLDFRVYKNGVAINPKSFTK